MRKGSIRHHVNTYRRSDGTYVRSYYRGIGTKNKHLEGHTYLEPKKIIGKRWTEIDDQHWRSNEDDSITVNVNKEELEAFDEDENETQMVYFVYPAYNDRGIPNSPSIFSELDNSSLAMAKKGAIEEAKKILKLPIDKIRNFDWSMINSKGS